MKADPLRSAIRTRPFRRSNAGSFNDTVHLADGREIPVGHPETVTSDDRCVFVYVSGEGFELLDVPLVTGINYRRGKRGA